MSKIIKQLESKISTDLEEKHRQQWEKQAQYMGNGVYMNCAMGEYSTDTRELFLMYVARKEKIKFDLH